MSTDGVAATGHLRMRDLGAYLTVAVARPLSWWMRKREVPGGIRWTREEVCRRAKVYPDDGFDVVFANLVRTLAWVLLLLVSLGGIAIARLLFEWTGMSALLTPAVAVSMFCGGHAMASSFRWSLATGLHRRLDRVFAGVPRARRPGGFLMFVTMPSNLDIVFAVLWSWLLTAAIMN